MLGFKNRNRRKDGLYLPISWTTTPSPNGILYSIGRDISQDLVAEKNLHEAKNKAEAASKTKANFLANMSHEIRTPMHGIIGNASLLMETVLSEEQLEMVETIKVSGDALLTLIDDILDFSKIEAGKLEIEHRAFDIRKAVFDSAKVVEPRVLEKAIFMDVQIDERVPDIVVSDYIRFRQILLNLISNAVKFTEKGSVKISVVLDGKFNDKSVIKIVVKDSGIGMTPEQQAKLFQDFSQVDASTTRRFGGTGLGLAICKQLCSLLEGDIGVHSELGNGSTFTFTIMAASGVVLEQLNIASSSKRDTLLGVDHPLRILVAEDNKTNQKLAVKLFKKIGYDVSVVSNGLQAFEAASKHHYDVVFMDINMPVMDGYDATRKIRSEVSMELQPHIIALTASVMQSDQKLCFDAGMNDFLGKPLELPVLCEAIEKFVGASSKFEMKHQTEKTSSASILIKFGNDFGLFKTVADIYLGDYQNQLSGIRDCLNRSDSKGLEKAAHSLKGAASNFSGDLVTSIAGRIEMLSREERLAEAEVLWPQLVDEASTLHRDISSLLRKGKAA